MMRSPTLHAVLVIAAALVPAMALVHAGFAHAIPSQVRAALVSGAHGASGTLRMSSAIGDAIAGRAIAPGAVVWHGFYAPRPAATGVEDLTAGPPVTAFRVGPNPASTELAIEFAPPGVGRIEIAVFDVSGRRVRTLHESAAGAGMARVRWDLRSGEGAPLAAGVYFVRARSGDVTRTQRIVIAR